MIFRDSLTLVQRKLVRRFNWAGLFVETGSGTQPRAVVAGFTRSGTTFLGRVLANAVKARPVHEPLNPAAARETAFFNEREALSTILSEQRYQEALKAVFSRQFRGGRLTNTGSRLLYRGRIVKIVRANHYLDYLSDLIGGCPFVIIVRNPFACVSSRLRLKWPAPDFSHCFEDIKAFLTSDQIDLYRDSTELVQRLAVSWCIDNLMLLRHVGRGNFLYVFYEDLVSQPEHEFARILKHIGAEQAMAEVRSELRLEWRGARNRDYLNSWDRDLNSDSVSTINHVLAVFGLEGLYEAESGLPNADYRLTITRPV